MHDRARITELIPSLRRYARALTTSSSEADKLVQATLQRALNTLGDAELPARVRPWLFSQMHEAYVHLGGGAEHDAAAAQPALPGEEARLAFDRAIRSLKPAQREVFLLVTLEDMSYDDVAKILNIPLGTVMSRLSRAREKLRLRLLNEMRLRVVTTR